MSRLVQDGSNDTPSDSFIARIAKYIPSEVLAFYVTVENIIRGGEPLATAATATPPSGAQLINLYIWNKGPYVLFFFCWLMIPIILSFQKADRDKSFGQSITSMIIYPVWVYSINGLMFERAHLFSPMLSAILLALVTLVSGTMPNSISVPPNPVRRLLSSFGGKEPANPGEPPATGLPKPPDASAG